MRSYSYLNTAEQILDHYNGNEPFATFLKKFFSQHKKYGSTDRKRIGHLCYCYFRLGKSLLQVPMEERILIGLFLCSTESNEILEQLRPEWNKEIHLVLEKKLLIINYSLLITDAFPWKEELSEGINYEKFCRSFFTQPDLFLRLRPGYEGAVKEKISGAKISFREINSSCLAVPNTTKVKTIIELDKEAIVQDLNSQKIGNYLKLSIASRSLSGCQLPVAVWDCCAGSGGKSLLLYDLESNIDLTVSDVRESILINLRKRFTNAGIKKYKSFVVDLTQANSPWPILHGSAGTSSRRAYEPFINTIGGQFDLIICDAPCTGSGTWSRTPEQLYFFDEKKIQPYSVLQKKIVSRVIPNLKPGGVLLYITCSVFKKENEEVVDFIKKQFHLELLKMQLLKGYDKRADSMFVSVLRKSL